MKTRLLFATLLIALSSSVLSAAIIPKGEIADKIPSIYDPTQTHAVYLPRNYSTDKKWPILFCYDPRGQGRVPAELFREGAERLGWIIISSNHSRSDDPTYSNLPILNAMWNDAHRWFSLDEKRIYATGFSGGARIAWGMGYVYPKSTAGVIGVGAGNHPEKPASKETPFVWYGMSGRLDYNYLELRQLDQLFHSVGVPSRTEFYEGPHSWPSDAQYCSRAMDWMELQAMKRDRRPKDQAWIQQQFDSRLEHAKKLESQNVFDAFVKYQELLEDFSGLLDTADVSKKITELSSSETVKQSLKQQKKLEETEEEYKQKYIKVLGQLRNGSEIPNLRTFKSDLEISKLKKESEGKETNSEAAMYDRLLTAIYVQVSFYFPQYFLSKKDSDRAIASLNVAAEIHEEDPFVWLNMAQAQVEKGENKKALESLQMAADRGLKNRKYIDREKSFDALKNEPQFQQILSSLPQ